MDFSFSVLEETAGDVFGLMICIPHASDELGLSNEQIMAFCHATPNGEELWRKFTARRDNPNTPEDYDFCSFMVEILSETDHPVRQ